MVSAVSPPFHAPPVLLGSPFCRPTPNPATVLSPELGSGCRGSPNSAGGDGAGRGVCTRGPARCLPSPAGETQGAARLREGRRGPPRGQGEPERCSGGSRGGGGFAPLGGERAAIRSGAQRARGSTGELGRVCGDAAGPDCDPRGQGPVPRRRRAVINWQEQRVSAAARISAAGISVGRGLGASGASPEWI